MYQEHKDIAAFYIVYVSEAHASDDRRPVQYATELGITEHKDHEQRCSVAERLVSEKKLTIPFLVDGMDNKVANSYFGHPDRLFLVRKDGKLGVAGKRGPRGFKPAMADVEQWLAEYKKTGEEPAIPEKTSEATDAAG